MAVTLEEIAVDALALPPLARGDLVHRLILSLEDGADDAPGVVGKAWDEEIARRVDAAAAGRAQWIASDDAIDRMDAVARGNR